MLTLALKKFARVKEENCWNYRRWRNCQKSCKNFGVKEQFKEFLENVYHISYDLASKVSYDYSKNEKASQATGESAIPLLKVLGKSEDSQIHERLRDIYFLCEKFEFRRALATSCNEYVKTVLCKKLSKYATFAHIQQCFDLSKRLLIKLGIEKELQLKVEDAMCQEWKEQTVDHKFTCMLQGICVKFMESSPIFPFTITDEYPGNSPKFSGVYLTYYVGENLLYGDHVSPSKNQPAYVGTSEISVLARLSIAAK